MTSLSAIAEDEEQTEDGSVKGEQVEMEVDTEMGGQGSLDNRSLDSHSVYSVEATEQNICVGNPFQTAKKILLDDLAKQAKNNTCPGCNVKYKHSRSFRKHLREHPCKSVRLKLENIAVVPQPSLLLRMAESTPDPSPSRPLSRPAEIFKLSVDPSHILTTKKRPTYVYLSIILLISLFLSILNLSSL